MSGIYIQMEMPKNCRSCRLATYEMNYGYICKVLNTDVEDGVVFKPWKNRRKDCPLISVPPHGRLIDADALHQLFEAQWHYLQCLDWDENPTAEYMQSGVNWCINTMHDEAPTIIPADRTEVSE